MEGGVEKNKKRNQSRKRRGGRNAYRRCRNKAERR